MIITAKDAQIVKKQERINSFIEEIKGLETNIRELKITWYEYIKYISPEIGKVNDTIHRLRRFAENIFMYTLKLPFGNLIMVANEVQQMVDIIGISNTVLAISMLPYEKDVCAEFLSESTINIIYNNIYCTLLNCKDSIYFSELEEENPFILSDIVFGILNETESIGKMYGYAYHLIGLLKELEHADESITRVRETPLKEGTKMYELEYDLKSIKFAILEMENTNLQEVLRNVQS